ncbi:hypothetical protein [Xenorhabdus anantnagensis]|uniref:Uncharacterized protein n=1 Tax=Xenorhabdus anantnagensis TaxID=3025875 RepID=A0ABT5LS64_9GAMM|nr:hypothetical protein [Xenorhabdus anantnagensis]MDC9597257.1 hypothetical protein [Xenorhabdus anantnagensis]
MATGLKNTDSINKIDKNQRKDFKTQEDSAPTYQVIKSAHRAHVGMGNTKGSVALTEPSKILLY